MARKVKKKRGKKLGQQPCCQERCGRNGGITYWRLLLHGSMWLSPTRMLCVLVSAKCWNYGLVISTGLGRLWLLRRSNVNHRPDWKKQVCLSCTLEASTSARVSRWFQLKWSVIHSECSQFEIVFFPWPPLLEKHHPSGQQIAFERCPSYASLLEEEGEIPCA